MPRSITDKCFTTAFCAVTMLAGAVACANAEAGEVRIAQTYGLTYLPTYVVAQQKLIEKHAKAAGLGDVKVTLTLVGNAGLAGDLLLSGNSDIAASALGQLLTMWDKTRGAQKVRGIVPTAISHLYLITVDPHIQSIKDYGENDRIALSAIKSGLQAMMLQMAVAKEFGWDQRHKLDSLTVAMAPADAAAALVTGRTEIKSHMSLLPFSAQELEAGNARVVMNSLDITGPGSSSAVITTEKFHDENPKLYAAIAAAYEDAVAFIDADKHRAAQIYVKYEPQKKGLDWIQKLLENEQDLKFTTVPHGTHIYADFMFKLGTMKNKLETWKDIFWDNVATKDGN
jgi:NitT/TauT family transport system substrate-binding protein